MILGSSEEVGVDGAAVTRRTKPRSPARCVVRKRRRKTAKSVAMVGSCGHGWDDVAEGVLDPGGDVEFEGLSVSLVSLFNAATEALEPCTPVAYPRKSSRRSASWGRREGRST